MRPADSTSASPSRRLTSPALTPERPPAPARPRRRRRLSSSSTLGVGLWVVAPPADRRRLLPRRPGPPRLGHPAFDRRDRDLRPHRHLGPRDRRARRPHLSAARRSATSSAGSAWPRWLLPGYFSGEQETAYARLESRFGAGTRRLASVIFLVTRFLGDGVRVFASAIPLALVTGWSVPIVDRRDGRGDHALHLVRRAQGGGLDRRDAAGASMSPAGSPPCCIACTLGGRGCGRLRRAPRRRASSG